MAMLSLEQDALQHLDSLQSPRDLFTDLYKLRNARDAKWLAQMRQWLEFTGHSVDDLDRLNVIHVAGTKGKGSVCAFANSILTHSHSAMGLPRRVGMFTSPHLITVRERIAIDSQPLDEARFSRYFFEVWDALRIARQPPQDIEGWLTRPTYFRFLTLLSFHVFLAERVDAAVYEVGVGGEFDATNIIKSPIATGVTALGIDHVQTLGNSLEEIAWHKAGIFKGSASAFSVPQKPRAMTVLHERAAEKNVPLQVVKPSREFEDLSLLPNETYQRENAALAVALADTVLQKRRLPPLVINGRLSDLAKHSLERTIWRGRFETLERRGVVWYLDGAHTLESVDFTGRWFADVAKPDGPRVLVFNQQSRDNAVGLLQALHEAHSSKSRRRFTHAIFCTNATRSDGSFGAGQINIRNDPDVIANLSIQKALAAAFRQLEPDATVRVMRSIADAIELVTGLEQPQTLVTGSLHLVGGVISVLDSKV